MQYFFFSLMIQDFKPGNNSVDVLICLRASRVGGWAKTMSARVERQRCHRSSYFTVPISNSWKSNKAHIIFQMHARKTPRIHRKKPTIPCIHRLFQLIFQKICGSMSFRASDARKLHSYIFQDVNLWRRKRFALLHEYHRYLFLIDGFDDRKKKKRKCTTTIVNTLDANSIREFARSIRIRINVSVDTWKVLIVGIFLQFSSSFLFFRIFGIDSS